MITAIGRIVISILLIMFAGYLIRVGVEEIDNNAQIAVALTNLGTMIVTANITYWLRPVSTEAKGKSKRR